MIAGYGLVALPRNAWRFSNSRHVIARFYRNFLEAMREKQIALLNLNDICAAIEALYERLDHEDPENVKLFAIRKNLDAMAADLIVPEHLESHEHETSASSLQTLVRTAAIDVHLIAEINKISKRHSREYFRAANRAEGLISTIRTLERVMTENDSPQERSCFGTICSRFMLLSTIFMTFASAIILMSYATLITPLFSTDLGILSYILKEVR
jgi:hypothetical protein